jgi:LPXTG-motif cell wall-anchored protein
MRHWLVLGAVYAVAAALVLPGSLLASDEQPLPAASTEQTDESAVPGADPGEDAAEEPVTDEGVTTEPDPEAAPAEPPPETAPAAPAPAEPAPATAPVAPAPAEPAPAEPAAADTAPKRKAKAGKKAKASKKAQAADTANVTISDYRFTPATVTVVVGDTVTWTNDGPSAHSATATGGSFDTGIFPAGESRSATFDEAGTFAYICTPHPNMEGTVVVEAAGSDRAGEEEDAQLDNDEAALDEDLSADGNSGALPNTGKDVRAMIILGLIMIAIGSSMSLRTRRQS